MTIQKEDRPSDVNILLEKLELGANEVVVSDKQIVYSPGEEADAAYFILEGQIKLAVFSASGKEAVIGICLPGQVFGEGCLSGGAPLRFSDATAIGPTRVVRVEKPRLLRLLREDKDFADTFLLHLIA